MLPISLLHLEYHHDQAIAALANRALHVTAQESLQTQMPWIGWRPIAEYMACVEFARAALRGLPSGNKISLEVETGAKYHSVAIVFFAQSLLDTMATWMAQVLLPGVGGGDRNFLKPRFQRELQKKVDPAGGELLARFLAFIERLNKYRQVWIHTKSGGARLHSTSFPDDPEGIKSIGIPVDPTFDPLTTERAEERAKQLVAKYGKYLYTPAEFADEMAEPSRELFFGCLRISLNFARA